MLRRLSLLLFLIITFSIPVLATGQAPDYLIVNDDTLRLWAFPLKQFPTKADSAHRFFTSKNAVCWNWNDDYTTFWQLDSAKLYLTNIVSCYHKGVYLPLTTLFGNRCQNGRVFADWVTGDLPCPVGKLLRYQEGWRSSYEKERWFRVEKGMLQTEITYENRATKVTKYEVSRKNYEPLVQFIYSNIAWDKLPPLPAGPGIKVFLRILGTADGKSPIVTVMKEADPVWTLEALRVVRSLPEWGGGCYRKGRFAPDAWQLPVIFSEENRKKFVRN